MKGSIIIVSRPSFQIALVMVLGLFLLSASFPAAAAQYPAITVYVGSG